MNIGRNDVPWLVAIAIGFLIAVIFYIFYVRSSPYGPSGGSWPGLMYAFVGTGMMLFAMLLSVRKKMPTLRVGSMYTWMQGHVWLGLLSYPLILFHAGFSLGGLLTTTLIALFSLITLSGILGLILQHFIPRMMTERLPMETIYEQIDHVLNQIRREAEVVVYSLEPETTDNPADAEQMAAYQRLQQFYLQEVKPFLHDQESLLSSRQMTQGMFDQMRKMVPEHFLSVCDDLERMVEERRQLPQQARLHHWLHGWLYVHVPLSIVLLFLVAVHAFVSIRYI